MIVGNSFCDASQLLFTSINNKYILPTYKLYYTHYVIFIIILNLSQANKFQKKNRAHKVHPAPDTPSRIGVLGADGKHNFRSLNLQQERAWLMTVQTTYKHWCLAVSARDSKLFGWWHFNYVYLVTDERTLIICRTFT